MTTLAARVSARLREALQDPEHYARRHKSAQGQQEFRWITIGAQDHEGGTHVQIKSSTGEIVAGPDALTGKKVGELGKPDHSADAGKKVSEKRKGGYFKGDRIEYTGKTVDGFHEFEYMEGHKKGKLGVTAIAPDGSHPRDGKFQEEWKQQQEEFGRLHKKDDPKSADAEIRLDKLEERTGKPAPEVEVKSPHIGKKWQSNEGERLVVGEVNTPGGRRLQVQTNGTGLLELVHPEDLDRVSYRETMNFESRQKARDKKQDEETVPEAVAAFVSDMPPLARKRAEDALLQLTRHNGTIMPRHEMIASAVERGAAVEGNEAGQRRLVFPEGTYLDESQVTKIGMDYASRMMSQKGTDHAPTAEEIRDALARVKKLGNKWNPGGTHPGMFDTKREAVAAAITNNRAMAAREAGQEARLREVLADPEHYARRHKSAQGQQEFPLAEGEPDRYRWITIGGGPRGEDGKRHPKGFPVEIDENGKILKSRAPGLQGKSVSHVKEHFDEQRKTRSGKPEHDDDGGTGGTVPRRVAEDANRIKTAHEGVGPTPDHSVIPEGVRKHLSDDQQDGAAMAVQAMNSRGGFLLADGTGVGKTRQALAVAKTMAESGKKVLIVTPKAVAKADFKKGTISGSWNKDSKAMGVDISLNNGDKPLEPGQVAMTTYENLIKIKGQIDKNTAVVFDEAHAFKNWESARAKHGAEISKAAHSVMFATATPADKVEHIGYMARAGVFGGIGPVATFQKLGMKQIDQHVGGGKYIKKWVVDGKVGAAGVMERMSALFEQMTREGQMVRREISLEGVEVSHEHVKLPPEAHDAMAKIKEAIGEDDGLSKARMLMAQRRQQEPYKVQKAVQDALADIKSGHQVVIFASRVNASEVEDADGESAVSSEGTMKLLKDEFSKHGITDIAEIHGGVKDTESQMNRFQGGQAKVVIATVESGGTGINLDDVEGDKPRSLIMLTAPFSAVENVQAAGRVWRRTTKTYPKVKYLFGDTDVDRWNADLIAGKMRTLGATVSGEMATKSEETSSPKFEWGSLWPEKAKPVQAPASSAGPQQHKASWTKLRSGDWGARIEASSAKPGDKVTVRSKDGRSKETTIRKVVWSGDGVHLAEVYALCGEPIRYQREAVQTLAARISAVLSMRLFGNSEKL